MGQLYYVAAAAPHELSEAQKRTLRDAGQRRLVRRLVYTFGFMLLVALIGAMTFVLYARMFSRSNLPLEEDSYTAAGDMVYYTLTSLSAVVVWVWVEQLLLHGAKHARSSVLWLRRFHQSDGAQRFFNKRLAQITPATFAVTLRDSKVTGNRREGMRRAMPLMFGVIFICLVAIGMWSPLWDWCQANATQCAIVDRIWMDPALDESYWDLASRSIALAFALIMTSLCGILLLWAIVYALASRFGDTRGDTIAGVTAWYEDRANGSPNRTYVLRTSDSDWQGVVSFLHDRSRLTVFDLTAPSKHLDYELSLARAGGQYAFICKASRGGPFADTEAFVQFLRERVSPDVVASLQIECVQRPIALRRLRALTETALPA